jgi:hypothetical protein
MLLSGVGLSPIVLTEEGGADSGGLGYGIPEPHSRRQPVPSHHLTDFLVLLLTRNASAAADTTADLGAAGFAAPPALRFLPEDLVAPAPPAHPGNYRDAYGSAYGPAAAGAGGSDGGYGGWERDAVGEPDSLNQVQLLVQ